VIDRQKHGVRLQLPRRCYRTGIFIFEINLMRTIKLDLKYLEVYVQISCNVMLCFCFILLGEHLMNGLNQIENISIDD